MVVSSWPCPRPGTIWAFADEASAVPGRRAAGNFKNAKPRTSWWRNQTVYIVYIYIIYHIYVYIYMYIYIYVYIYTIWLFNIAMENGPFIDNLSIKTSIYKGFSMAMLNSQRVNIYIYIHPDIWFLVYCIEQVSKQDVYHICDETDVDLDNRELENPASKKDLFFDSSDVFFGPWIGPPISQLIHVHPDATVDNLHERTRKPIFHLGLRVYQVPPLSQRNGAHVTLLTLAIFPMHLTASPMVKDHPRVLLWPWLRNRLLEGPTMWCPSSLAKLGFT